MSNLDRIIDGGGSPIPFQASQVRSRKLADHMAPPIEAERQRDTQQSQDTALIQRAVENRRREAERKREERSKQEQQKVEIARDTANNATEGYARRVGRPTFTDASGDIRPVHTDEEWQAQQQQSERDRLNAAREERNKKYEATKAARVTAAKQEADRYTHELRNPELQGLSDSDRKRHEEEATTARQGALIGLMPEIEKRLKAKYPEDKDARKAAIAAAQQGQVDPDVIAALEAERPEVFAAEKAAREAIALDDQIRGKRKEVSQNAFQAGTRVLEEEKRDPLMPEDTGGDVFDQAGRVQQLNAKQSELATRRETLLGRQNQAKADLDSRIHDIEVGFQTAVRGRLTQAEYAILQANRQAAILDARADYEAGNATLAEERVALALDAEEFNRRSALLNAAPRASTPPQQPQETIAPSEKSPQGGSAPEVGQSLPPSTLKTAKVPGITPQSGGPSDVAEVAVLSDFSGDLDQARDAAGGKEIYVQPGFERKSTSGEEGEDLLGTMGINPLLESDIDQQVDRAGQLVSAITETINNEASGILDAVASGTMTPDAGREAVGAIEASAMESPAAVTSPDGQTEPVDKAGEALNQITGDAVGAFFGGRMSLRQLEKVLSASGVSRPASEIVTEAGRRIQAAGAAEDEMVAAFQSAGVSRRPMGQAVLEGAKKNPFTIGGFIGLAESVVTPDVEAGRANVQRMLDESMEARGDQAAAIATKYQLSDNEAAAMRMRAAREAIRTTDRGALEAFAETLANPGAKAPFVGDLIGLAVEHGPVIQAAMKVRNGEELTEADEFFLESYIEDSGRDSTLLGNVVDIVTELPSFGTELALTGSVGTLARKGSGKAATKLVGKEIAAAVGKWAAKRSKFTRYVGRKGAGVYGATFQTPFAMADKIAADTIRATTIPGLEEFDGDVHDWISKPGKEFGPAASAAFFDSWAEVLSEKSGGVLGDAGGLAMKGFGKILPSVQERLMRSGFVKALKKLNGTKPVAAFSKLARRGQFHGSFSEILEERVGDAIRATGHELSGGAVGEEWQWPTPEQWATEAVAFMIPNVGFAALNTRAVRKAKQATRNQLEIALEPVTQMGTWSDRAAVADGANSMLRKMGADIGMPVAAPFDAAQLEAIEEMVGPIRELPAVRRLSDIDQRLARSLDDAENVDDLDKMGRLANVRVAASRSQALKAIDTLIATREAAGLVARDSQGDADQRFNAARLTGSAKIGAGRPAVEITQAEQAALLAPLESGETTAIEVNGKLVVTDAGRADLQAVYGDVVPALLPMSESKARRWASRAEKPKAAPPTTAPASQPAQAAKATESPAPSTNVPTSGEWSARGARGTRVTLPEGAAKSETEAQSKLAALLPVGEMLDTDSLQAPPAKPAEPAKVSNPVRDAIDAAVMSVPADLRERARDLGTTVADVIEGLNAGGIFPGGINVIADANSDTTAQYDPGSEAMTVNLAALANTAGTGPNWVAALMAEEVIHRASTVAISPEEAKRLWNSLPIDLQAAVRRAYDASFEATGQKPPQRKASTMGHEFIRMVVQDRAFRGMVSEAMDAESAWSGQLLEFLQRLVTTLREMVSGLPAESAAVVDDAANRVIETLREMGVKVDDAGTSSAESRADEMMGSLMGESAVEIPPAFSEFLAQDQEATDAAALSFLRGQPGYDSGFSGFLRSQHKARKWDAMSDAEKLALALDAITSKRWRGRLQPGPFPELLRSMAEYLTANFDDSDGGLQEFANVILPSLLPPVPAAKETNERRRGVSIDTSETRTASVTDSPTPVSEGEEIAGVLGDQGQVFTGAGEPIDFQWAVVEAASLVTSHADDGSQNPNYDQSLQGRNRDSAASDASVADIAKNTQLSRLSASGDTASGAPIIGPDGMVESGNGRSMGIRRAYRTDRPNVATYRADLARTAPTYGLDAGDIEVMRAPVLVRIRRTEVDRKAFADDANRPTVAAMSEREQALSDAKLMTSDMIADIDVAPNGDLYTPANRGFFGQFFKSAVTTGELPNLVDADGALTAAGLRRIRNAIFVAAYGDSPAAMKLFERMAEDPAPETRNVVSGLISAAPAMARHRASAAVGREHATTFPKSLLQAAGEYMESKVTKTKIADILSQKRMFDEDSLSPLAAELLQFLDAKAGAAVQLGTGLRNFLTLVERAGDPRQQSIFGDEAPFDEMEAWQEAKSSPLLMGSEQEEMVLAGAQRLPTKYASEEYPYLGVAPADWRQSTDEEASIVNPINPDLSPDEKVDALNALSRENVPIVEKILADLKAQEGLEGKYSLKESDRIQAKASRPSIREEKPWHDVEHVRDGLRFKVSMQNFEQLPEITRILAENGVTVVKFDTKKMFHPKAWGWRFVAYDMRMPNGQLVEFYAPVPEMDNKAVKGPNHHLFEKWRNVPSSELEKEEIKLLVKADIQTSAKRYNNAFTHALSRMGYKDLSAAEASWNSLVARAESVMAENLSISSSAVAGANTQSPPSDLRIPVSTDTKVPSSASTTNFSGNSGTFTPDSTTVSQKTEAIPFENSLGIPRRSMPQIPNRWRAEMVGEFRELGIDSKEETVDPGTLSPSQSEYFPKVVARAVERLKTEPRRVLVSRDDYVLDGHHQYVDAVENQTPLEVIRLDLPARDALEALHRFADRVKKRESQSPLRGASRPSAMAGPTLFDWGSESNTTAPAEKANFGTIESATGIPLRAKSQNQGNLFDWTPNEGVTTLATAEQDGNGTESTGGSRGRLSGGLGTRRPAATDGDSAGVGDQGSDSGEFFGDLFARPSRGAAQGSGPSLPPAGQPGGRGPLPNGGGSLGEGDGDAAGADLGGDRPDATDAPGDRPDGGSGGGAGSTETGKPVKARKPRVRAPKEKHADPENEADRNFRIPDGFEPSPGGKKPRIEANFDALKLLRQLEQEGRNPTPEEKAVLVRYTGWGSFKEAFNDIVAERADALPDWVMPRWKEGGTSKDNLPSYYKKQAAWKANHGELHDRLKAELSEEEYQAASHSIMNAHFTSAEIIDGMWQMARKAGYRGGKALEPGAGVGHFIGRIPEDLRTATNWDAVELDEVTSRLLGKLYPEARVNSTKAAPNRTVEGQGFQVARLANNSFDLVISNVPFARTGPGESQKEFGIQFNLHNYFFARALAKTKPGGLVMFVTTHYSMDASVRQREWIAERSELIHAVRLPKDAFEKNAGTEVVTDIILLRKPDGTGAHPAAKAWKDSVVVGSGSTTKTVAEAESNWKAVSKDNIITGWKEIPATWVPSNPDVAAAFAEWNDGRPQGGGKAGKLIAMSKKHGTKDGDGNGDIVLDFQAPIEVNEYFAEYPDQVIGTHGLTGSMYSDTEYTVEPPASDEDRANAWRRVISATPEVGASAAEDIAAGDGTERQASESTDRPGTWVERDGKVWQVGAEELTPAWWLEEAEETELKSSTAKDAARLLTNLQNRRTKRLRIFRSWVVLRDAAQKLVDLELTRGSDAKDIEAARKELNRVYNLHTQNFGNVAKGRANPHAFLEDDTAGYSLVHSLEEVTRDVNDAGKPTYSYAKAPVFRQRVLSPVEEPESADNAIDAMAISLGFRGRLDVGWMAQLADLTEEEVTSQLVEASAAFEDPLTGLLTLADEYLSGNVVEKLRAAEKASEENPAYRRNVKALQEAQPEQKTASQIGVSVGARWIPQEVYTQFLRDVLGYPNASVESSNLSWSTTGALGAGNPEFSTDKWSARGLFDAMATKEQIRVWTTVGSGADEKRVLDKQATAIAYSKAKRIQQEFETWIKSTPTEIDGRLIGEIVAAAFNEKVNLFRPPTYKGDWITLPDQSGEIFIDTMPHRKAVLARMLTQGYGMMAHGVGSGKTYNQIALAHELKRMGIAKRPVIVVQNSTIGQFAASYRKAYPQARLLIANTKGNFSSSKRARFYAQMALGDWDAIIMPHSAIDQISHEEKAVNSFFMREKAELLAALALSESGTPAQSQIQKALDALEERLKKMLIQIKARQDKGGMSWEQLGVDALIIDEAHAFKNAPVITKRDRIKNLPTGDGADRAVSMQLKVRSVQSYNGESKGVYFATGTPVTNTMAEVYVMLRYLAPHLLEANGIISFDHFADTFAEIVETPEANWKGNIEITQRLAKFRNGQSLINLIRSVFDVALGNENLGLDVPAVKGGVPRQLILPPTAAADMISDWMLDVADQYDALKEFNPKAFRDDPKLGAIPILTMQTGVAAALDPRMVDARAPDLPGSKVNRAVDEIMRIYAAGQDRRTTQAVFTDLREPFNTGILAGFVGYRPFDTDMGQAAGGQSSGSFDLYEDIKAKLVARGMKPEEIWWPPKSAKPEQLEAVFDKINSGEIRVVIGSTAKIGVGVNMQERLAAVHHLMPPRDMKPAMMEQRNGRIIRQGNLHRDWADDAFASAVAKSAGVAKFTGAKAKKRRKAALAWLEENPGAIADKAKAAGEEAARAFEIEIMEYAVEKSLDSAIFSMMAAKQGFIAQALSSANTEEEFADPADEVQMGMAEMAARTMGDADMIRMVELEREVKELRTESSAWLQTRANRTDALRGNERELELLKRRQTALEGYGAKQAGLFDDPKAPPVWSFGRFTIDQEEKDAEGKKVKQVPLTGSLTSWLSGIEGGSGQITVGPVTIAVQAYPGEVGGKVEGVAMISHEDVTLARANFSGAGSLIQQIHKLVERLDISPAITSDSIASVSSILARLKQSAGEDTAQFPQKDQLRAMEDELVKVRNLVETKSRAAADARKARRAAARGQTPESLAASLAQVPDVGDDTSTSEEEDEETPLEAARRVQQAARGTDTNPSDAQKEAGNYRKGKVDLFGLSISIENPKGSERRGTDANGKAWSVTMDHHYGYFLGTEGKDGDHVDTFIGPRPDPNGKAFVVNQRRPGNGHFDEHKVMIGFDNPYAAAAGYRSNYMKGWKGLGSMTPISIPGLKAWLAGGDMSIPLDRETAKRFEDDSDGGGGGGPLSGGKRPPSRSPDEQSDDHVAIADALAWITGKKLPSQASMESLSQQAQNEPAGARTIGNPDIANYAEEETIRREIDAVRHAYEDTFKSQTHEQWENQARAMVKKDPDGLMRSLVESAREGRAIESPEMVKAAQILIPRLMKQALATGDKKGMRDAQAVAMAYAMGGTEQARALAARRDPFKSPEERHEEFFARLISKVGQQVLQRAERAPTPAEKSRRIDALKRELTELEAKSAPREELIRARKELSDVSRQKDRSEILEEAHRRRLETIEKALAAMGITLHDIFSNQAVVRLRGSEIVARVIEENFSKPQRAALRLIIEGFTDRQIAKKTGIDRASVEGLESRFRKVMRDRFLELARRGMSLRDFEATDEGLFDLSKRIGEDGDVLRGADRPGEFDADSAADEMMNALMPDREARNAGRVRKPGRNRRAKDRQKDLEAMDPADRAEGERIFQEAMGEGGRFDIGDRRHVAQAARILQAAVDSNGFDMVFEYWINNILSGPQTHTVNITGNALNIAMEYGLQRWMEASFNTLVQSPGGATFGEYRWLGKMLPGAWAPALEHARLAWATEESFFEADVLRDPVDIGEPVDKLGGSGKRTAIAGKKRIPGTQMEVDLTTAGRIIRIPGRALLFMDTLFKGVIGHMEVGAQAFRIAKAEGLKGAAMDSRIRGLINLPGSAAWIGAVEKARELTFTTPLRQHKDGGGTAEAIVKTVQDMRTSKARLGNTGAFMLGWIFPFIQTPFNIFKSGLRRTPLGLAGIGAQLLRSGFYQWRTDVDKRVPFEQNYTQARMVRDLTDQTIAWLITGLLWSLSEGDPDDDDKTLLVTGGRPFGLTREGERALLDRTEGGSFQLRIGKRNGEPIYVDFGRLEPIATILATTTDAVRAAKRTRDGTTPREEMGKLFNFALDQAKDKTFLKGLEKIHSALNGDAPLIGSRDIIQGIVPNIIRQPARNLDDYVRNTKTAPWYYHALPLGAYAEPRFDAYGQPIEKAGTPLEGTIGQPVDRLLRVVADTGLRPKDVKPVADTALVEWNREHPNEPYYPGRNSIATYKNALGQSQPLTAEQIARLEQVGGQRFGIQTGSTIPPGEAMAPSPDTVKKISDARRDAYGPVRDAIAAQPAPPRRKVGSLKGRSLSEILGWGEY